MSDETTQFILGDAAADAIGQPRRRRFFGRKKRQDRELANCENCGAPLTGQYCAQCGQHAIDYRRSLVAVLLDAADSFFNWDTKFLKSVGVLLIWPWRLTNDFNAGRRARYVHPLRLYLLASIAFFLLAKLINLSPHPDAPLTPEARAKVNATLAKLVASDSPLTPEQRTKIEKLQARWAAPGADQASGDHEQLDKIMQRLPKLAAKRELQAKDMQKLDALLDLLPPDPPPPPAEPGNPEASAAPMPRTSVAPKHELHFFNDGKGPKPPFATWLEARVKQKVGDDGTNVQLFLDTLRNNIPTMMLCCIPLFAFVLKILYLRQRRYYVEHLIYALHIHTFAYIAVVVIALIGMAAARSFPALETLLVVALSIAAAVLVFVSIRRVYRQAWFFTTFKFVLGGLAYLIVLILAVGVTAFVTLVLP